MKKVFSGIQPTGNIHIGNYLGAVKRWVSSQDEFDNIFCIVNLHAITIYQDPKILKEKTLELAGILLAAGIDPKKSLLFVQSEVSAHAELAWMLNCLTPMGWMQRMTQFKEKSLKQKENVTVGLFDYPILMAADILLYNTDMVPVGEDQVQHVELARDIAKRFNSMYGETFKVPEATIPKVGARIMGLDDPTKKMSKSEEAFGHAIGILDTPEEIRTKISRATTDSQKEIKFDTSRPGIYNLLSIYQLFSGLSEKEIENRFSDKGYGDFKKELAEIIIEGLKPLQNNYQELTKDPQYIEAILSESAKKADILAQSKLKEVKTKLGLV